MNIWEVLGIQKCKEENKIKQAYYEKLKDSFIGRSAFPAENFYQYSYVIKKEREEEKKC